MAAAAVVAAVARRAERIAWCSCGGSGVRPTKRTAAAVVVASNSTQQTTLLQIVATGASAVRATAKREAR